MLNFIQYAILWTLAIFGAFEIIHTIINSHFHSKEKIDKSRLIVIVKVKDGENYIEGLIRDIILEIESENDDYIKKILIIDEGSEDETNEIIRKMESDYSYIKVVNWDDYNQKISQSI